MFDTWNIILFRGTPKTYIQNLEINEREVLEQLNFWCRIKNKLIKLNDVNIRPKSNIKSNHKILKLLKTENGEKERGD